MYQFSKNQQSILDYLLGHQEGLTADELVEQVGVTKTAVKGHINRLTDLNLLGFKDQVGVVGRPKRRYFLTAEAAESFPKQYSWLSIQLLEQLSSTLQPAQLAKFMRTLADRVFSQHQKDFEGTDTSRRIKTLANLMNTLGYKAKVKSIKSESVTIEAFNCVYHGVAQKHPELCEFDRQLISRAANMNTTLESCIAKGGVSCRFCLKKR